MTEHIRSLAEMIISEQDPGTKNLLELVQRWWKPPIFEVPEGNNLGIEEGSYTRGELYPIMVGGYKSIRDLEIRQRLATTSKTIYAAMLLCDDSDPSFQAMFTGPILNIDS